MVEFFERNRFILAFVVLNAIAGMSVGVAKITTSLYAVALNASALELSLIAGVQSVGVLLMSMPVGVLVDQYGPKRLFMAGSLLGGVGYLLLSRAQAPLPLALGSLFVSFCMPSRFVSMNAVFMQQLEKVGVARAGWLRGTHMIGFFLIGPALAVSIIHSVNYSGTYLLIALSFVLTAALSPYVTSHYQRSAASARKLSFVSLKAQFNALFSDRELVQISAIEFSCQAINQYYTFFIVAIAINHYGFSAHTAASLVSVQGAVFILALFTLGGWVQRLGVLRAYQLSFTVMGIALLLLGVCQKPEWLWVGGGCLGLGSGLLQTVNISRFATIGARIGRGSVAGINAFAGPSGSLMGGVLGGMVGQMLGLQKTFLLFIPVLLGLSMVIRWRPMLSAAYANVGLAAHGASQVSSNGKDK
ncbi:MAG: MFS transporter [Pseudomonadota bacterium]